MKADVAYGKVRAAISSVKLRGAAAFSRLYASVAHSRLATSISYRALSASASFTQMYAQASYVALAAAAELGQFIRSLRYTDLTTAIDTLIVNFTKALNDAPKARDSAAKSVSKNREDAAAAADILARGLTKALQDAGVTTDASLRSFAKSVSDFATATDDVNGALAGDDQYITFFKSTNEAALAGDVLTRMVMFSRDLVDVAVPAETLGKSISKSFADAANTRDSVRLALGDAYVESDYEAALDVFAMEVSKAYTEDLLAYEAVAKSHLKSREESLSAADTNSKTIEKAAIDYASTSQSGTARSQGYSDFEYFAEDFVGDLRNF